MHLTNEEEIMNKKQCKQWSESALNAKNQA